MMSTAVSGVPRIVLRAEGAALALVAVLFYAHVGESWWLFAILFLAPDLSFAGYLGGARMGAALYNAAHTLVGPLLLATAGIVLQFQFFIPLTLIWVAHVGFDRLLGYGLKYAAGFNFTHLGQIGRASRDANLGT